ncbi:dTMP kinase [Salsipaludibacter albus]|uniref:dTMP kinase n=1 Tax=Salsipaludibacter albus TaxID=2849650 RepID=UPI001EE448A1|nr:dTMP kinase [Salsipaludibacter albus]MBY5161777.1 dTMP kinase [Salsipaludibacter albus]
MDDDTPSDHAATSGGAGQFGPVLRSPFKWVLYASLSSSLGDWMGFAAITAFTTSILGSDTRGAAFGLSAVLAARFLPTILLGPIAGVFADRWDRRRLMIFTDVGRALVMLAIPFAADVWALILATLAVEVMATLFIPVKDAIIPNLVPRGHLVQANQLSLLSTYGTFPLGFFGYAAIVSLVSFLPDIAFLEARPSALAFWFNGLTFLLSAWFVSRIPGISGRPERLAKREERPGAGEQMMEGLRFIAGQPLVRALIMGVMGAALAAGAVIAVGEFYAGMVNAGPNGFGILAGIVGTGLFLGVLASTWLEPRVGKERMFAPAIGVAGGALIATALMPRLDLAIAPALLMGAGGGIALLTGYTMLQEYSADEIRGRTFGAFNTGVRTALFAATTMAPFLVGVIGPEPRSGVYEIGGVRITLIAAGLLALVGAVYSGWAVHRALQLTGGMPLHDGRTRGMFVVFEGGDGAGKSTQMRLLAEVLREGEVEPILTREPGGTAIGERLRDLVLDPDEREMSDRAEAMIYAAARAQHVSEVISPALEEGKVVICDRFVDSSIVYQGVGRGLGSDEVARLNRWATGGVAPDLVVLLDVPADEGLRRSGTSLDRLESAGLDFHLRVNEAFRRLAAMTPSRYLVVDATRPAEESHAKIREAVLRRLDPATVDVDPDVLPPAVLDDEDGDDGYHADDDTVEDDRLDLDRDTADDVLAGGESEAADDPQVGVSRGGPGSGT